MTPAERLARFVLTNGCSGHGLDRDCPTCRRIGRIARKLLRKVKP